MVLHGLNASLVFAVVVSGRNHSFENLHHVFLEFIVILANRMLDLILAD